MWKMPPRLGKFRNNSVFVNGLSWVTGTGELRQYFKDFGRVMNTFVFMDNYRGISKGHALVQFEDDQAVEAVLQKQHHVIDSTEITVKKNESTEQNKESY